MFEFVFCMEELRLQKRVWTYCHLFRVGLLFCTKDNSSNIPRSFA